jgi:redox-sensitive bicupin YhaK (pirin superfamily)
MLEIAIEARKASIAPGMEVRRILPFRLKRMVGPFIFMDHGGPIAEKPAVVQSLDVLPHPHIGLSTVSYLFKGKITHRDSLGVEQIIQPGEVNWMTAGKGIAHSERFEDPNLWAAGGFEMIQTWVALPEQAEETDPTFVNYQKNELPVFTDTGVWMRLIAGNAFGLKSDVKTHSPLFYLHIELDSHASLGVPKEYEERAVYVVDGSIEFGGRKYEAGNMLVFKKNSDPTVKALEHSTLMVLGGEPLGERFIWWNFVSSRKERIEQAKADWQEGRIILPPNDNQEFIPLPEDRSRPAASPPPGLFS